MQLNFYLLYAVLNHSQFVFLFFFSSFQKGGMNPKFVIIDDGWQSVGMDPTIIACKSDNVAK
jgi:Raffinose synthase or seed imbibition protein Sip1